MSKFKINTELTTKEYEMLLDILGHVNFDKEESQTFWSMYHKLLD